MNDATIAMVTGALSSMIVAAMYLLRGRRGEKRRVAWRSAACSAGLAPEYGPWVVANVGGAWVEAGDHAVRVGRSSVTGRSALRALITAALPDGLVISTSRRHPGIVRETLRTSKDDVEVIVRGIDAAEVRAFLADGRRNALSSFFAAVPDGVIEAPPVDGFARRRAFLGDAEPSVDWGLVTGAVYVWHDRLIDEAAITREVSALVALVTALQAPPGVHTYREGRSVRA